MSFLKGNKTGGTLEQNFDKEFGDGSPVHKGLFGISGVGRDIFGLIGDTLTGNGGYTGLRKQENIGDAMAGFDQDPVSAIQKLTGVDPKMAQSLFFDFQKNNRDNQKNTSDLAVDQSQIGENNSQAGVNQGKMQDRLLNTVRGVLGTANDKNYSELYKNIVDPYIRKNGLEDQFSALTPEYNKDIVDSIISGGVSPEERMKAENNQDYRMAQTILEGGRLKQEGIRNDETIRSNQAREATANERNDLRQQDADTRRQAVTQRGDNALQAKVAKVVKANPGARVQRDAASGRVRYSTDGGKTWKE